MHVLVVEDDAETADYICSSLRALGHVTDLATDGKAGFLLGLDGNFDVMVVDRMLPGLDGLAMVKAIRASGVDTPVLFLSALGGLDDRVTGLEAGADDYLVKPFAFSELSARLTALARRPPIQAEQTRLTVGDLTVDLLKHSVTRAGEDIPLQPREFRLLSVLMKNADRVVTRTMLLEDVWDFHFDPQTNVVETHISRLRNKIDKPFDAPLIHTVRGAGYSIHV
ncbi:winged helix-turn-helix domain-containing protein [Paracoccus sp. R86501]|uniref:winged helix-turn-helix domain-containing protein n=1 Tax=Paracoccus sp. R86501 TaxID=3101711 RepID=UPI0036721D7D